MAERMQERGKGSRRNLVIVASCVAFTATMLGAAYAAVPLYELFCRVTGFGGTPGISAAGPLEPIDRDMTVRFDSNVSGGLPWSFEPVQREVSFKVGEVVEVAYEVTNTTDETTWARSTFNVTPYVTGGYFHKIQCFCFDAQKLGPGETREMPVVFYVDPAIEEESEADSVTTITLSYTFFPIEPPAGADVAEANSTEGTASTL